ncbi:MAG: hypothetical protein QHC67_02890 [Sphingobium sp.]|uniref:hypothetical protein n=1 Tax=Sphingobium sp. TaxID=1912891 RepID=UPI0029B46AF1|nr:hypothetical protein [Sphingobium sp.]MDX3908745.1 hypothetical protein [Sphingobium sp.]
MGKNDTTYFLRRASEEHLRAAEAACADARKAHSDLAKAYEARLLVGTKGSKQVGSRTLTGSAADQSGLPFEDR